ncbi:MAG: hypothetical protein RRX92_08465 [Lachnospiraceae bacterium]
MLKVKFKGTEKMIDVEFSTIAVDANQVVELIGQVQKSKNGFEIFRENGDFLGDYATYTSIYREVDGGLMFSTPDLKPWIPPAPEPLPIPPTPEEIAEEEKRKKVEGLRSQIAVLKEQLNSTDYKPIKNSELKEAGKTVEYEPIALHIERQLLRDEINKLEKEIIKLG